MSVIIAVDDNRVPSPTSSATCKVLVLYEDSAARLKVMQMCERLVEQFSDDLAFEFSWLKFQRLTDPGLAAHVRDTAGCADIVMFCTHGNDLPPEAVAWLDNWFPTRNHSKRAIALLFAEPLNAAASLGALRYRLENAATRLGIDFLPLVLPPANTSGNDQQGRFPISYSKVQPSDNLHYHWGLNE